MRLAIWMLLAGHVGARLETGQFHLQVAVRPPGPDADDFGGLLPQYLLVVGEGSRRTRRLLVRRRPARAAALYRRRIQCRAWA